MKTILGLLAVFALAISTAAAQETLRYNYEPGQRFAVVFKQELKTATQLDERPIETQMETSLETTWLVESVDAEGRATLRQTIDRIQMKLTAPAFGTLQYDSAQVESEAPATAEPEAGEPEEGADAKADLSAKTLAEAVAPLVGAEMIRVIDGRGQVVSAKLSEEAQRALAASSGRRLNELLSEAGLAQLFRQVDVILPEGEVKAGEEWSDKTTIRSPFGPIGMTFRYRLLEAEEEGIARFAAQVECDYSEVGRELGISMRVKEQTSEGSVEFVREAGRLASLARSQKLTLESTAGDQSTQQTLETKMELTVTPKP